MEFKIQKSSLLHGLFLTHSVAERKTTMPILSNVLIEAKDRQVTFTSTDLEVGIIARHQAEVIKSGKVAVPAKNLYDITKELSDNLVHILVLQNHWLDVNCSKSKFKIVGSPPDEFPSLPTAGGEEIEVEASVLIEAVDKISYAMSSEETRYTLNGVFVEQGSDKQKMRLVATDGHRLSSVERPVGGKLASGIIIPKKGVFELRKILDGVEGKISIKIGEKTISAATDGATIICRLIDGQFPQYKQIIPSGNNRIVSIDREQFTRALRRVSTISGDKAVGVKFSISSGNLDITSTNPDIGEAHDELVCSYKGEVFEIGFNAKYFLDVISVLADEKIVLELKNDTTPCVIRSEFDKGFLAIVMPMRL